MGKATKKIRDMSPEAQAARAELKRTEELLTVAGRIADGAFPLEQRNPATIRLRDTKQRWDQKISSTETVIKLSRVEMLLRRGVLEQHHARACEWYADAHEEGFATIGVTANYLGAGGGGFGSSDLLARYTDQRLARENYDLGRRYIPAQYLGIFEAIVCGGSTLRLVSELLFGDLEERPARRKVTAILRLCADRLYGGIAPLMRVIDELDKPIARAPSGGQFVEQQPKPETDHVERRTPMLDQLRAGVAEWQAAGKAVGEIRMAEVEMFSVLRELGHDPNEVEMTDFEGIPVTLESAWQRGVIFVAA